MLEDLNTKAADAGHVLEVGRENQRKRKQSFFQTHAEPILIESGKLQAQVPTRPVDGTISDTDLERQLQKARKDVDDRQEALEEHRCCYRINLERWLLARTQNTKSQYDVSYYVRTGQITRDIREAEQRRDAIMARAAQGNLLAFHAIESDFPDVSEDGQVGSEASGILHAKQIFAGEQAAVVDRWRRQTQNRKSGDQPPNRLRDRDEGLLSDLDDQDNDDSWSQNCRAIGRKKDLLEKHVSEMDALREDIRKQRRNTYT